MISSKSPTDGAFLGLFSFINWAGIDFEQRVNRAPIQQAGG